jgi:hypothetical protein
MNTPIIDDQLLLNTSIASFQTVHDHTKIKRVLCVDKKACHAWEKLTEK